MTSALFTRLLMILSWLVSKSTSRWKEVCIPRNHKCNKSETNSHQWLSRHKRGESYSKTKTSPFKTRPRNSIQAAKMYRVAHILRPVMLDNWDRVFTSMMKKANWAFKALYQK